MKRNLLTLITAAVLVVIFVLLLFVFQVRQSEIAVVTTFGKPTSIAEPGPHLKWPWPIQKVYKFDARIQNFQDKFSENLTTDSITLLTSVSGIGPRLALNILSGMPVRELQAAIEAADLVRLVSIPGIGKKTAERVVVELRDKVRLVRIARDEPGPPRAEGLDAEAVSALVNLGYRHPEAERAVRAARTAGEQDLESVIRGALKRLSA